MKLWAISDLHLNYEPNRRALEALPASPEDWLILAGDVGDRPEHLEFALTTLEPRFAQLIWVPGNHDLWTVPGDPCTERGEHRYRLLVSICQQHGTLTPEDEYATWKGHGPDCTIVPLFLLYDYTFRPDDVPAERAVLWAMESGILCADEGYLHPDPHPTRAAWCDARLNYTLERLSGIDPVRPTILINHFPLRRDLVRMPRIPRFSIWCGTRRTEDWHRRFRAAVVVSGHLHMRSTDYRDGVRFEEVSLGYPQQWNPQRELSSYLREVLPGPPGQMM